MDRSAVHLLVSGRVQGVAFRARAVSEATRLGLSGWIRNRMDGTVEARAEGPPEAIETFVAWCHQGPPAAQVEDVRVTPVSPTGVDRGFQVGTTG
ncbi:MAG TPA: acylphosphatase [Myxococcaceae bacterium]|nr:acylphosphatase [Myxococcaceae bacterium]